MAMALSAIVIFCIWSRIDLTQGGYDQEQTSAIGPGSKHEVAVPARGYAARMGARVPASRFRRHGALAPAGLADTLPMEFP